MWKLFLKEILIIILNISDIIFTLVYIKLGIAIEKNPFMNILISIHPFVFLIVKMSIVCLSVYVLSITKNKIKLSSIGLNICLFTYICVNIYHIYGIVYLL